MGRRVENTTAVLLACALLSGCGPSQVTPPTDAEMLWGLYTFQKDSSEHFPPSGGTSGEVFYSYLNPVSVRTVRNDIPKDAVNGKLYTIQVVYGYRVLHPVTNQCRPDLVSYIHASSGFHGLRYAHPAREGEMISCPASASFIKSDDGWRMDFGSQRGVYYSYLFAR